MNYKDRTIKFASNFVDDILNKTKTVTYRLGSKYDFLQVGDTIGFEDSSNGNIFTEAEITHKSYKTFHELSHERQERFKGYYGREIADIETILVLQFEVL